MFLLHVDVHILYNVSTQGGRTHSVRLWPDVELMFSVNVRPYLEPKKQPSSRSLLDIITEVVQHAPRIKLDNLTI